MIYGYARVSSVGQARDGNSLEEQETRLRQEGCETIYCDSYTGTKMDRPEFSKLISVLRSGDKLVVTKLDRFARSTIGGIETINDLMSKGVSIHILNIGLIDNTHTGRLIVTILLAVAEFERGMIVERTMSGKAVAKAHNPEWREGRKKIEIDENAFSELLEKNKKGEITVDECCERLGIKRGTWYNRLKHAA